MHLDLTRHKYQAVRNGVTLGWFSNIGAAIFKIWYGDPEPHEVPTHVTHIKVNSNVLADSSAFPRIIEEVQKSRRAAKRLLWNETY